MAGLTFTRSRQGVSLGRSGVAIGSLMAILIFAAHATVMGQTLGNPSFDTSPPLYPGGVNILVSSNASPSYSSGYTLNTWGAENGSIVSTGNAGQSNIGYPSAASILPLSNPKMLDLAGAGTGSYSQVWQTIEVSQFTPANQALIASGNSALTFGMYFNRPDFVPQGGVTPGNASVQVEFFSQNDLDTYSQENLVPSPPFYSSGASIPANTWTPIGVTTGLIPSNTAYILLAMDYNNASMTDANGVNYDGYVDDVSVSVPEPASMGTILLCGVGFLRIRKRKSLAE